MSKIITKIEKALGKIGKPDTPVDMSAVVGPADSSKPEKSLEDKFVETLSGLQCRWQNDTESVSQSHRYYFDYQGGHFIAIFYKPYNVFELLFMNVQEVPMYGLNETRSVLNRFNNISIHHRFFYSKDASNQMIGVHISMTCYSVDYLAGKLESFFSTRRDVVQAIEEAVRLSHEREDIDLEADSMMGARERFLLDEQELRHQHEKFHRSSESLPVTLSEVIAAVSGHEQWKLRSLTVVGDTPQEVNEDVEHYPLHNALGKVLPEAGSVPASFEHKRATLIAGVQDQGVKTPTEQQFTLTVTADSTDGTTLYYRVQVLPPVALTARDRSMPREKPLAPQAYSFLLAYDLTDPSKKLAEFDYMWKEAQIKDRDKNARLSDEEELLCQMVDPNDGFNAYWGRRYINEGRYFEALRHLRNAYRGMRIDYFAMDDAGKEAYFEICYLIGLCYNELGMYENAYFFAEQLRESSRLSYCKELVNTLVNAGDIRAFHIIDRMVMTITSEYESEEEYLDDAPNHVKRFMNFLRRRRAYASIDYFDYDHAEKEFKALLDDPESHDYAIGQLAYIKRMREEQAAADNQKKQPKNKKD